MGEIIRKISVIVNPLKDDARAMLLELESYFNSKGIELDVQATDEELQPANLQGVDLAISLGGDGTLLYCARACLSESIPILAVNLGKFGFITEIISTEWIQAYEQFVDGKLGISKRIMIMAKVVRRRKTIVELMGLNDAVIGSVGVSRLMELNLFLAGSYVGRYRADGVIVSTPTGSTAYSMGAGGPILHPEMEAFILNPICPFTLSNRPLVVPAEEVIELELERAERTEAVLTVDGQQPFHLSTGDRIRFEKPPQKSLIIRSDRRNFYEILRSKLNWSGEPNA